ncbi:MAG: carboxypeptidase-like regulatory domain-containing protein, partial [Bacteroidaceae bacterium]|nr:carboxypeptidase-like regulatory domain-containing protein [Bacteroidaceae bacterium]
MRHFFIALVAMTLSSATAFAQKITVTGQVVEKETAVSCISANVVLLNPKDSTQASGVTTDVNGQFRLPAVAAGNYILRISYMGFKTHTQNLTLAKKPTEITLGKIELAEDAKLMEEAVVSQNVAMVEQKEDTFVF